MARFRCKACHHVLEATPVEHASFVDCPNCNRTIPIPALPTFTCGCGASTPYRPENAGRLDRCRRCQQPFTIPGTVVLPPTPPPVPLPPPPPRRPLSDWLPSAIAAAFALLLLVLGMRWLTARPPGSDQDGGPGDEKSAGAGSSLLADSDLPYLRAASRGLFSLRVADIWQSRPLRELWARLPVASRQNAERLSDHYGFKIDEIERVSVALFDATTADAWAVIRLTKPWDEARRARILGQARQIGWEKRQAGGRDFWVGHAPVSAQEGKLEDLGVFLPSDRLIIAGRVASIKRLLEGLATGKPPAPGALAGLVDSLEKDRPQLLVAGAMNEDDIGPWMPWKDAKRGSLTATFKESSLVLQGAIGFTNEAALENWARIFTGVRSGADLLGKFAPPGLDNSQKMMLELVKFLTGIKLEKAGAEAKLSASLDMQRVLAYLPRELPIPVLAKVKELSGARQLAQIALAMKKYHEANGCYPPLIRFSARGQPLYSWRVCLLPYFGPTERALHAKLDVEKPWDHPANKEHLEKVPDAFSFPAVPAGHTPFLLLTGAGGSFAPGRKTTKETLKGNPLLAVVSRRVVPWAGPVEDVKVPDNPRRIAQEILPELGLMPGSPIEAIHFDGSARQLPASITGEAFLSLTRSDGKR